jgi:coenzyme PQQ precursor peptide PqqA
LHRYVRALTLVGKDSSGDKPMKKWTKPRIRVISVGLEINAYACAEL